jgi:hypothetical protein
MFQKYDGISMTEPDWMDSEAFRMVSGSVKRCKVNGER